MKHAKEYDIVHVHIPNAAFAVLGCAKKYGVPVRILHSHNAKGADGTVKKIRNFLLNKWGICYANQYFACGAAAGRYLYGKRKCDSNQITILNNAIDLAHYQYKEENRKKIRTSLGIENELLLGHMGRFAAQKNHSQLIDILAELKKRGVCSKLVLLGDGSKQEEIRQKVRGKGLEEDVIFAGVVKNAEEYLSAMDIFLLPSLYEGLPVVCVEAQAAGLPCVISKDVTREIGLTESVYFIDRQDTEGWCDCICRLAEKLPERNRAAGNKMHASGTMAGEMEPEQSRAAGMEAYDIQTQAKRLEEIYRSYGETSNINVHL